MHRLAGPCGRRASTPCSAPARREHGAGQRAREHSDGRLRPGAKVAPERRKGGGVINSSGATGGGGRTPRTRANHSALRRPSSPPFIGRNYFRGRAASFAFVLRFRHYALPRASFPWRARARTPHVSARLSDAIRMRSRRVPPGAALASRDTLGPTRAHARDTESDAGRRDRNSHTIGGGCTEEEGGDSRRRSTQAHNTTTSHGPKVRSQKSLEADAEVSGQMKQGRSNSKTGQSAADTIGGSSEQERGVAGGVAGAAGSDWSDARCR